MMAGFSNSLINGEFKEGLFENIVNRLLYCSEKMVVTCKEQNHKLENDENKIRNHLLENYLNNNLLFPNSSTSHFRFVPESSENYDILSDSYAGRADIKVVTANWFNNEKDYYLIECKRIDGKRTLNKEYVNNGICRFVVEPVKYKSHNSCNIMFGFVVKQIDIFNNAQKINEIQKQILLTKISRELSLVASIKDLYYTYSNSYNLNIGNLEMRHIFYNFSEIISV